MRLLDLMTPRERADIPATIDGSTVLTQAFASPDNQWIQPSFLSAQRAYKNNSIVFGVILARLSLFSEAEFKYQRLSDRVLYGSQGLSLLENPWPNGTTGELLARMEQDNSLAGNFYVANLDTQLARLRPDQVTIISTVDGNPADVDQLERRNVVGYWYNPVDDPEMDAAFYPVDRVAHWSPIPDPLAPFRGMSWMTPVLRDVEADEGLTDYKRAYLTNAATPNLIIKYEQSVGDDVVEKLRRRIGATHSGPANAFGTLILDRGADTTIVGNNLADMDFSKVQAAGENRIAVAAGVPAIVAGLETGLGSSNIGDYEVAMRRFADLTMRTLWRSACACLQKVAPPPPNPQTGLVDSRLWFDATQISALRQGEKDLADTMQVLAAAASDLIFSGWEPASIITALTSGDLSKLVHTGLTSVQLRPVKQGVETTFSNPKGA